MDGLILVDKPSGWTSHDAVAYLRGALKEKRAGHTGTLDPDATGLLLVLTGKATRLARYYDGDDKGYRAVMRLGSETDTQDAAGMVVRECPVPEFAPSDIEALFEKFLGEISQTPPMYSAVKVEGRPLYKHARAGVEVARAAKRVVVKGLGLIGIDGPSLTFDVLCSKGTYVRTLCRDMGEAFGSCAHLESLRRTAVGRYRVEDAVDISGRPSREELLGRLVPLDGLLPDLPFAVVGGKAAMGIKDGRRPARADILSAAGRFEAGSPVRVMDEAGRLIAFAEGGPDEETPLALKVVLV